MPDPVARAILFSAPLQQQMHSTDSEPSTPGTGGRSKRKSRAMRPSSPLDPLAQAKVHFFLWPLAWASTDPAAAFESRLVLPSRSTWEASVATRRLVSA